MSRYATQRRRNIEPDSSPDRPKAAPVDVKQPSCAAVLSLQRAAGNQAVCRAFDLAASGTASEVPFRGAMEAAFRTSFADVRSHRGGPAARLGLGAMDARAATRGSVVVFGEPSPEPGLVAHELAHVVQQRRGAAGVARSGGPDSVSERAAEGAAHAVTTGGSVPDLGSAHAGDVQRAPVTTAGGEWDTTTYVAVTSGARVGAEIDLKFTPTDPVVADQIGLTQSVKALKSTSSGGAIDTPGVASPRKAATSLGAGSTDPGRAIDQGDPGDADTIPNTNPLYAVENAPGSVSATLTDVPAAGAFGSHASRKRKADGTFDVTSGNLKDTPGRGIEFAGQEWQMTFEATAIALDGPLAGLYLGSVEWGWKSDAAGTASVAPSAIQVVRQGPPTSAFMEAAAKWNAATFIDPSDGASYDTVDLPIEAVDAGALATADLVKRLADAKKEAATLAGDAKTRKDFEVRGLERELGTRNAKVAVKVKSTEDWIGSDHVYVQLKGKSKHKTPTKKLNDGDSHDFLVPLTALTTTLPLTDPIEVEVYDEDWPDGDDLIVRMTWSDPYAATSNSASMDDADYAVTISYER